MISILNNKQYFKSLIIQLIQQITLIMTVKIYYIYFNNFTIVHILKLYIHKYNNTRQCKVFFYDSTVNYCKMYCIVCKMIFNLLCIRLIINKSNIIRVCGIFTSDPEDETFTEINETSLLIFCSEYEYILYVRPTKKAQENMSSFLLQSV